MPETHPLAKLKRIAEPLIFLIGLAKGNYPEYAVPARVLNCSACQLVSVGNDGLQHCSWN
jgi:hypothetical protein